MKNLVDTARAKFLDPAVNLQDPMVLLTLQKLTQPIDTVISSSTSLMSRRHALESDFNNAFADLLRQVAGTQIAIGPGFRFDTALAPGANITIEDVYKMFPVQITMATAQITGSGLRSVLETALTSTFSTDSFSQWGGWFPALSGVRVAVDMSQPDGARIQTLTLKETGQLIADTTVVSVAGCVRPLEVAKKLCGYAGFSNFQNIINPATNAAYTVADIIIDNLQSGAVFSTPRQDIDDVSLTPFWPEIEFIQPFGLLP